ncbi:MAG: hypothetical protein KIT87_13075 [Anaerolineae bacterium]|nr:hypothetical protein [Anaerolineae bacterium]
MFKLGIRILVTVCLFAVLILVAPAAHAADPRTGDTVIIPASETVNDDVYLFGEQVIIDGVVKGDAVAIGQTIIVNGTVEGSLMSAGTTVTVNGHVGHAVRAAGYGVRLGPESYVGKDVLAGAYSVIADRGSQVLGDMFVGSYQARLDGEIGEDYRGGQTALEINGVIHGNVEVAVDPTGGQTVPPSVYMPNVPGINEIPNLAPGLRVGDQARIGGTLRYASPVVGQFAPSAQVQGGVQQTVNEAVTRAQAEARRTVEIANSPMTRLTAMVRNIITLILIGLLLVWLAWNFTRQSADVVALRPLPAFGWGFVTAIGVPFVALLLLVVSIMVLVLFGTLTLGGLGAATFIIGLLINGGLVLVFMTGLAWLSKVVVGLAVGQLLLSRFDSPLAHSRVWPMVLGVTLVALLVALLNLVPMLGGLVTLLIDLVGLGALALTLWNLSGLSHRAAPTMPPAPMPAR